MTLDQDNLRRKNDELNQAYKDKSRKLLQTQELYDKLKRRAMLGQIQDAASDAVDTTLQGGATVGVHPPDHVDVQEEYQQQFGTPTRPAHYAGKFDRSGIMPPPARMVTQDMREGIWDRQFPQQGERNPWRPPVAIILRFSSEHPCDSFYSSTATGTRWFRHFGGAWIGCWDPSSIAWLWTNASASNWNAAHRTYQY